MPDDVYYPGALLRIPVTWQDGTDAYADPSALQLSITQSDGTTSTYTWVDAQVMRDSVGHFHYDLDLTGAIGGQWFYRYVATGAVQGTVEGYFTVITDAFGELVSEVRDEFDDHPVQTYVQDDPLPAAAPVLTIPLEDAGLFLAGRSWLEIEQEELVTTSPADDTAAGPGQATVGIRHAQHGTTARPHPLGSDVLISPRFSRKRIVRALNHIISSELWPYVWNLEESSLTYQAMTDYYPAPAPDVSEVVYGYQLSGGTRWPLHVGFLNPELADAADFPYGAITIPRAFDGSTIYFGYRARPTIGNLSGTLRSLAVMGAVAYLQLGEENKLVGPDVTVVDQGLVPGARSRAGLVAWQMFKEARAQENITLLAKERDRRVPVLRGS